MKNGESNESMQVLIKDLPNGYRQRARFYCEFNNWEDANLGSAFPWNNTYEGIQFWNNIYKIAGREGPLISQSDISKLPTLPQLDIKAYRPTYIGWCKLIERSMIKSEDINWSGFVTVHTSQPPFNSYFVTARKDHFRYHAINERYWPELIKELQILKKIN